jgi:hypothetical protein
MAASWDTCSVCYCRSIHDGYFSHSLRLLKFIVGDLCLTDQNAAADTLDQVTADGTEPPSGEGALPAMTNDDELRSYFLGDIGNFLPRISGFHWR